MKNLRLAFAFTVLTLAAHTNAAAAPLPHPKEDLQEIKRPTILYRGQRDDKGVRGLRLVDWDGQNDRSYMYDPFMQFITVNFSPDGRRFCAVAFTRNGYRTLVYDIDGNFALDVTPNRGAMEFHDSTWSRDGKWIVLSSYTPVGSHYHADVYKLNIATGKLVNLTNAKELLNTSPSWSPSEDRIAFDAVPEEETARDIYVIDADGKNRVNLTNSPKVHDTNPHWSPDGKRIAFTSNIDTEFPHYDLFVMDADGSNIERLTRSPEWDYKPSWSPDGKWVLFASGLFDSGIPWDLYRIHVETKEIVRMTHGQPGGNSPTWVLAGKGSYLSVDPAGKKKAPWGKIKEAGGNENSPAPQEDSPNEE